MRCILPCVVAFLALMFAAAGPCVAQTPPRAVAGIIDLTRWNFTDQGAVDLAGDWVFTSSGQPDGFLAQPGPWSRFRPEVPALGRHTLSLSLMLPPQAPPLALVITDLNSAFRLTVNGAEVEAVGQVADSRDLEIPVAIRSLVRLPDGGGRVDLSFDISNFHHFEGGIVRAVRVGPAAALRAEATRLTAVPLVALGALTMVMLLLSAFWLSGKRDPLFLVFAAYTALLASRTFAAGHLYTLLGHEVRADIWYLPPCYLAMYVCPGLHLGFLRALFPAEVPRKLVWPVYAPTAAMVALMLLAPSDIYTRFRDPFQILILLVSILGAGLLVRAVLNGRPGAALVLAGSLVFTVTVWNDALHYLRVIRTTDLTPLGFAAFAIAYCAALALRLFRSERMASERLAEVNRGLEARVAERTASAEEAKSAAERASSVKSEFLAVMSHEIRTPLHGWAGLTQLLEKTDLDDRQRHYVDLLRGTAEHLTQLIGNILDMSRIEAGRLDLASEPFHLGNLVDELAALGRAQAVENGLAFDLVRAADLPVTVVGDAGAIRQIILNFLGNAAKFTSEGSIRLSVAPCAQVMGAQMMGAQMIRFAVTDTGCGIPAGRLGDIFEIFTQVDASTRRSHGGSGLGLAICRNLAEMMGGRVGVDSVGGAGTSVWCDLPLPVSDLPVSVPALSPCVLPPGIRVLFADDVELNRLVLREFLAGTGAEVDEATDGAEAVTKIVVGNYNLAVLDLRMPGMDGFEAARAIRRREQSLGLPALPLAALSAGAAPIDRHMAAAAGFTMFLSKPIDRATLIAALAELLPPAVRPPLPAIPAGLEHMLPLFIAEMAKDSVTLQALAHAPLAELAEHAHAMRGKCAMFGEDILYDFLTRLEQNALAGEGDEIPSLSASVVERARQLLVYDKESQTVPL